MYLDTSIWGPVEDMCHVFRFIWSENVWVQLKSIGERAIFIGVTLYMVSEHGPLKNMSEKIYYLDKNGNLKFVSLKDAKGYRCEGEEDFEYRGWLANNENYRFFIEQP